MNKLDFEIEEMDAWQGLLEDHSRTYFIEVLNGEKSLEEAREDLASFRNSEWYTGTREEFKEIKEND